MSLPHLKPPTHDYIAHWRDSTALHGLWIKISLQPMLLYHIIHTSAVMQLEHLLTEYARGLREQTPRLEVCSGERVSRSGGGERCSGVQVPGGRVIRSKGVGGGGCSGGRIFLPIN